MTDAPYTNRELDMKFKSLEEKNDAWSATILRAIEEGSKRSQESLSDMREHEIKPILAQTRLTNGRVGKLEDRAAQTESLITWMKGGAYFFVPAFVAVSGWLIVEQLSTDKAIDEKVYQSVQAELSNYEIITP